MSCFGHVLSRSTEFEGQRKKRKWNGQVEEKCVEVEQ